MNRRNRTLLLGGVAAVALLVVLFALLRPSDKETAATATVTTPITTGATTMTAPTTTATTEADPITVELSGGRLVGEIRRATVRKGDLIRLRVTGAPGEEIHVHGYDETLELGPDGAGTLAFDARLQGVFEVELERAGVQIVELTVR